jgi:hypothetical protein
VKATSANAQQPTVQVFAMRDVMAFPPDACFRALMQTPPVSHALAAGLTTRHVQVVSI